MSMKMTKVRKMCKMKAIVDITVNVQCASGRSCATLSLSYASCHVHARASKLSYYTTSLILFSCMLTFYIHFIIISYQHISCIGVCVCYQHCLTLFYLSKRYDQPRDRTIVTVTLQALRIIFYQKSYISVLCIYVHCLFCFF